MTSTTAFVIKSGDLLPLLTAQLSYSAGVTDKLTDVVTVATPVVFIMRAKPIGDEIDPTVDPIIDRQPATVAAVNTTTGVVTVRYEWQPGDTDEPGTYLAEFEFEIDGDLPLTAPTSGWLTVHITQDLG